MIQPLRQAHRVIFFVAGITLPLLFGAGLASRHAPLVSMGNNPAQQNQGTEFVSNRGSLLDVRLIETRNGGQEWEFMASLGPTFVAPDVFVYWSESKPESSLAPDAKFLGSLGPREMYQIPAGSTGYFVLYSVAQKEVLGFMPVGAGT
jgi:hypothetical protein